MNTFPYCPYYCEENAWHLCAHPALGEGQREVLIVSNPQRQVAVWRQKASPLGGRIPVLWDYHVLVATVHPHSARIWDLDSTLGLDVDAGSYLQATFQRAPPEYLPQFRRVSAEDYRALFASDRRHMRQPGGAFTVDPPAWAPIGNGHNLDRWVDMVAPFVGEVLDLPCLRRTWRLETPVAHPD